VEQWLFFEKDWKEVLARYGVSSLHMKEFAHSRGEFCSWKDNKIKRQSFLSLLIATIRARVHHSFVASTRRRNQQLKKHTLASSPSPDPNHPEDPGSW
jgi:hypothetical protein